MEVAYCLNNLNNRGCAALYYVKNIHFYKKKHFLCTFLFLHDKMNSLSLFFTVFLAGIILVVAGLGMAMLLSPKSFNLQKGEPYECGIPTHGTSWMQFKAGYYLYAILYLMFDVEAIFLFPWATIVRDLGFAGLTSILFFLIILALGLAYAWRKGVLQWK